METANINTPSAEVVKQIADSDQAPHRDAQQHLELEVEERMRALRSALPWWDAEKYHWHASESGFIKLRPNPEFLSAVIADTPRFEQYGIKKAELNTESDTTERLLVLTLTDEIKPLLDSLNALDERELKAFQKFVAGRCTYNCVYAAINQFEIDNWVARASRQGKDPSTETNFGEKESRRDSFAIAGAVWGEVARRTFGNGPTAVEFQNAAKSTIYTQADMKGREYLNPKDEAVQDATVAAAAVAASRPF